MANLREKVDVEMENISAVLSELTKIKDKSNKSIAELVGIGAFLHNFTPGLKTYLNKYWALKAFQFPSQVHGTVIC